MAEMFERTDTCWAPWTVIDGDDKLAARIAVLTAVSDRLEAIAGCDEVESHPAL